MIVINNKILVVDITLNNNMGVLNNCVVFKDNKKGELSTQNIKEIQDLLEPRVGFIGLQNKYTNTTLSLKGIEKYSIKEINLEDF